MSRYVKTFNVKNEDEYKNKKWCLSVKMTSSYQKDIKLLRLKLKTLKNIELNALPVYNDRYIKTKVRAYGDNVYTIFRGLNVLENDIKSESFTVIWISSIFKYRNKYCLKVYLDICVYKTRNKQMIYYLDGNLFEADEDCFL